MSKSPGFLGLIVLLTACLSACGYQLRGQASLPGEMSRTFVSAVQPRADLVRQLTLLLEGNQVEVVDQRADAGAVLQITEDRFTREIQSSIWSSPRTMNSTSNRCSAPPARRN